MSAIFSGSSSPACPLDGRVAALLAVRLGHHGRITIGYFAFMESSRGSPLGKMALKLKVTGARRRQPPDDGAIAPPQLLLRDPAGQHRPDRRRDLRWPRVLAAVIMIAVSINNDTVDRQGWHDKFAGGTHVLKIG